MSGRSRPRECLRSSSPLPCEPHAPATAVRSLIHPGVHARSCQHRSVVFDSGRPAPSEPQLEKSALTVTEPGQGRPPQPVHGRIFHAKIIADVVLDAAARRGIGPIVIIRAIGIRHTGQVGS